MPESSQQTPQVPEWVDKRFPPELYLFFSVDIEGSTSFKNIVSEGRSTWGPFFLEFFDVFPSRLAKCEADVEKMLEEKSIAFDLWKSLGDELIFYKKLNSGFDTFSSICAAQQAIVEVSQTLRKHRNSRGKIGDEKDPYPTHLKGTAWIAGFPIKNMKIPRTRSGEDFIGPSFDLGFRLTKLSSPWHMVVSAPLAWMIAKIQVNHPPLLKGQSLKWFYRGRETLKGVTTGKVGYPVFCIDLATAAEGVSDEELNLLDRGHVEPRDVYNFCETLFTKQKGHHNKHGRPFILGDNRFGLDIPQKGTPERDEYDLAYNSFLMMQPMVSEPTLSESTSDVTQLKSAIDAAKPKSEPI